MVAAYTVSMATAVTPLAPHEQFTALDRAFGLWIGADDELLSSGKVLAFADLATSVRPQSQASCVPDAKHLSILVKAHDAIGPWLARQNHEDPT